MPPQPPKLLDQMRAALRERHYPAAEEEANIAWVTRFILFHDKRHPDRLTAADVMAFLKTLASDAERGQARTAILFLYRQLLDRPLDLPADPPPPTPQVPPSSLLPKFPQVPQSSLIPCPLPPSPVRNGGGSGRG